MYTINILHCYYYSITLHATAAKYAIIAAHKVNAEIEPIAEK